VSETTDEDSSRYPDTLGMISDDSRVRCRRFAVALNCCFTHCLHVGCSTESVHNSQALNPYGRLVCDAHSPCFTPAKHARNMRETCVIPCANLAKLDKRARNMCRKHRSRCTPWPVPGQKRQQALRKILPWKPFQTLFLPLVVACSSAARCGKPCPPPWIATLPLNTLSSVV
jgi:hypothetical protein